MTIATVALVVAASFGGAALGVGPIDSQETVAAQQENPLKTR
ncbi:hypothetical protein [Halorubrum depositum]|nr:hypothetical protein [Halorubrum depositum]